jgi:hypothetical protein
MFIGEEVNALIVNYGLLYGLLKKSEEKDSESSDNNL